MEKPTQSQIDSHGPLGSDHQGSNSKLKGRYFCPSQLKTSVHQMVVSTLNHELKKEFYIPFKLITEGPKVACESWLAQKTHLEVVLVLGMIAKTNKALLL
jgi:hypothetical protein